MPTTQTTKRYLVPRNHAPDIDSAYSPVNDKRPRLDSGPIDTGETRANARYLQLVAELVDLEKPEGRGWQTRVARRLGVDQSFVSRLLSGELQNVGAQSISKAVTTLGLRADYFEGPELPSTYRHYLANEPHYAAWQDFVESPIFDTVTPDEHRSLATFTFPPGMEPSFGFYEGLLYLLRNEISLSEFRRGVAKAAELHTRARDRARARHKRSP